MCVLVSITEWPTADFDLRTCNWIDERITTRH